MGRVLRTRGLLAEALGYYESALHLDSSSAETWQAIGDTRLDLGDWNLAAAAFQQGLDLLWDVWDHRVADLSAGLGFALFRLARLDEAVGPLQTSLNLSPKDERSCRCLALALEFLGETREAVGAWVALGVNFEREERFEDAAVAYRQAIIHQPSCLRALINLAVIQRTLGDPWEAIRLLRAAVTVDPKHGVAHAELGRALYRIGDTDHGFEEFRWLCHPLRRNWRDFGQKTWTVSAPQDQTVLLWCPSDQTLGEAILFIRYTRLVKRQGAKVFLECPASLVPLVNRAAGIAHVSAQETPLPPFDLHLPLTTVPAVCDRRRRSVLSEVPYLSVSDDLVALWRQRLFPARGMTVGISLRGDPQTKFAGLRSLTLAQLELFATIPGIRFIDLQSAPESDEVPDQLRGIQIESLWTSRCSLEDKAALMMNLDLVITADTEAAHLAGALARPTWTLLARGADWHWALDCEHSAWYPTVRLLRQRTTGDWTEVLEHARAALEVEVRSSETSTEQ
jgi:tetratricopeptide (TPR) repeat protein